MSIREHTKPAPSNERAMRRRINPVYAESPSNRSTRFRPVESERLAHYSVTIGRACKGNREAKADAEAQYLEILRRLPSSDPRLHSVRTLAKAAGIILDEEQAWISEWRSWAAWLLRDLEGVERVSDAVLRRLLQERLESHVQR